MTEYIIVAVLGIISGFIINPIAASKYAKYFLKMRDYLNLLFPESLYPRGAAFQNPILPSGMTADKVAVPVSAVKDATVKHGFAVPFITQLDQN